jgi:hypothetical protein
MMNVKCSEEEVQELKFSRAAARLKIFVFFFSVDLLPRTACRSMMRFSSEEENTPLFKSGLK